MMTIRSSGALAGLALGAAALAWTPAFAVTHTESPDAGDSVATAQLTPGGQSLSAIFGSISSGTDADLYFINIVNPAAFSATTVNADTGALLDTQLFLFTANGRAVFANDDDASGLTLQSTLPAGNAFGPLTAGKYLLGIAVSGYDPVNANNQLLFDPMPLSFEVRGPNSGVTPTTLGGFFSLGFEGNGAYRIDLNGAVGAVPEPAAAWLALAGLGVLVARRRRG